MGHRLDNIPVYQQRPYSVSAVDFNRAAIAIKRFGEPVRIPLTGLRSLELVLDHESWVVIDTALNDVPVLAWTDFSRTGRAALHEPVPCVLKAYHAHALVILSKVTARMESVLHERIEKYNTGSSGARVVPLSVKRTATDSGQE